MIPQHLAKPLIVSHSGANTLTDCEHKFFHQYIVKTEKDRDYIDPVYFNFGRAAHAIVEWCRYDSKNCSSALVKKAIIENGLCWESDAPKVMVTLPHYWAMQAESETEFVGAETWFENDLCRGRIDGVVQNKAGEWFLVENKWIGTPLDLAKPTLLKTDQQIGLYVAFADDIAAKLNLHPDNFAGVRYREIEKPRQRFGKNDTHESFLNRLLAESNIKHRETVLTPDEIQWESAYQNFLGKVTRARELQQQFLMGSDNYGLKNQNNCTKFGTPCPYWSQCYGKTYSESKGKEPAQNNPTPPPLSFDEMLNFI